MFIPLLCPLMYISAFPLVTYWYQYSRVSSTTQNLLASNSLESGVSYLKIISVYVSIGLCALFTTNALSAESRIICSTTATSTQLGAAVFFIIALSYTLKKKFYTFAGVELGNLIIFSVISISALLLSANALSAFFALELLGALTLYGFFVFGSYKPHSLEQTSTYMSSGAVYQFILNFIGSFIFYVSMALICAAHGAYTFFAPQWSLADNYAQLYQSVMVLAILIKLGTGPWIFYKFSIYKSFTVVMSVLYTFIYFTGVIIFLYNMYGVFGINTSRAAFWGMIFLLSVAVFIFSSNVYQTGTMVLFLSFSSLLNLTFMILQIAAI